ncbi:NAD-dependent epimerase/dehydratase family protein [Candidatus Poriferisodalis sp.]|uniref:NAD-dependent epimerase/dehydratase family protein n=1 Tax=Candidatus Poriferisodalis sp. TaxID=3101277 RepID=UPI003C704AB9
MTARQTALVVGVYRGFGSPDEVFPLGMPVPLPHGASLVGDGEEFRKLRMIRVTEEAVFEQHPKAIHLRYPRLYGPRQPLPREWPLVRRALDRRAHLVVADGGLTVKSQGWVGNAAHATLLACDAPPAALGGIYNVADSSALTIAQIAEIVADELGHSWELVSLPYDLAVPARPLVGSWSTTHRVLDIGPTVRDLGYQDVLAPTEAWRAAARWLADHPLERGGALEQRLGDPFDYEAEDRLVAAWKDVRQDLGAAVAGIEWIREPNYGSAYVGNRPNPGVTHKRGSLNS